MLVSKKHSKSPPEKPLKKLSKVSHPSNIDPLNDTDDESTNTAVNQSNLMFPKVVENTYKRVKITYRTKVGDTLYYMKHVDLLKKLAEHSTQVQSLYNKRHEVLKPPALEDLNNQDIYFNHFQIFQVVIGKNQDEVLNTIIQEYKSTLSLYELKRQTDLIPYLNQKKIKINEHEWTPEVWNTQVVGFIPKYTPSYFPKEYVHGKTLEFLKSHVSMPEFKIRKVRVSKIVLKQRITVQVYAIEVKREVSFAADKVLLTAAETAEDYVSFRTQYVNEKAFEHAVALTAQIQNDTRAIVINNVSEEAFFILDSQVQQVSEAVGYYHSRMSSSIRIIVQVEDFIPVRKKILTELTQWNELLDPSDIRTTGYPKLATILLDDSSEGSTSQMSLSVSSLLSFDISALSLFSNTVHTETGTTPPISDITIESFHAQLEEQSKKIQEQDQQIQVLMTTIQMLNDDINTKFDKIMFFMQTSTESSLSPEVQHDLPTSVNNSSSQAQVNTKINSMQTKVKPKHSSLSARRH
jgi:hypothetical protein